jgi:two-component system, NtrC family, nitrogen regulation sensor histidine kinase NtrY
MSFRRKLLLVFSASVALSVAAVAWLVQEVTRKAFEESENQRTSQLVNEFQREFNRQGEDVTRRVENIAASETVTRMAAVLKGSSADSAEYFDLARSLAESHQLDFLELLDSRGMIVSSAQWPAKFGYPDSAFQILLPSAQQPAFLKLEQLQDSTALGLFTVRTSHDGEHSVYVVGGRRLDKTFLSSLNVAPEMRVLLYQNSDESFSSDLLVSPSSSKSSEHFRPAEQLAPLVDAVRRGRQEISVPVRWSSDRADEEIFHAIPLRGLGGDRPLLGILLVGQGRRTYVELTRKIRDAALLAGGGGIVLALFLSGWAAARVTRPIEQLAGAAQSVTAGKWDTRVQVSGNDEISQLASSFNQMTTELLAQKERLVQAERVAAWRELARRLAHELKNPLFPLQLTVENLIRARMQCPEQFEEVFRESSQTLLTELANLKAIIGRFSEFSKMPQPQLQPVNINEVLRGVARLFQAQFKVPGKPALECRLETDEGLGPIAADPELLHRAISNLVLNAMDAMPQGGRLSLLSRREPQKVVIEVTDTGAGLTPEECARIFTPYYTSKQHGSGLGLAIVQSVVSDHGGTIMVRSQPGKGTAFVIELPERPELLAEIADGRTQDAGEPVRS